MSSGPRRVFWNGLTFDQDDLRETTSKVVSSAQRARGLMVLTVNVDIARQLKQHASEPWVQRVRDEVGHWTVDGVPLTWLLRLAGFGRFPRVTGTDLMNSVVATGSHDVEVVILGAGAVRAADHYAGLGFGRVKGGDLPYADLGSPVLVESAQQLLDASAPQIVFVCLAFPKGEVLTFELRKRFPSHVFVGAGAGAQFNSGSLRRAPRILQKLGFEWAWRLVQDPRRMVGRYLGKDLPWLVGQIGVAIRTRLAGRPVRDGS